MKITSTPWGTPDQQTEIAPGIITLSTPSHGGIWLSAERRAQMPAQYGKRETFAGGNWYEEDCDWALVALSFPQYFDERAAAAARSTLGFMDRDKAAA